MNTLGGDAMAGRGEDRPDWFERWWGVIIGFSAISRICMQAQRAQILRQPRRYRTIRLAVFRIPSKYRAVLFFLVEKVPIGVG